MATQSVRIGWRPYVNLTSVQAASNLLDSYSGSAAAYSLRKLRSSYSGSAIRVRRSSDNAELNIGFDSDGNLDTYALSAFVGTGDGFVTTWYDQSGNVKNATQSTAANQPYIIVGGALQTLNGKPSLFFNGESRYLDCGYLNNGTKASNFSTFISANFTAVNQTRSIFSSMDAGGNGKDTYNTFGIHSAIAYQMFGGAGGGIYYKYWRTSNVPTQSLPYLFEQHYKSNISPFIGTFYWNNTAQSTTDWLQGSSTISGGTEFKTSIGRSGENNGGYHQGFVQEIATYFSDQMSNRSGIVSNINTYYSIYPNPSSVWNLLTAAYSADAVGSSSLKTSLVSVYNGESNANDSKGTNNGTAQGGLTYGTGKIGNAFNFNGSNAYVKLTTDTMKFAGDFSISAWCYFSGASANTQTIFSNLTYDGTYGYGYYLYYMNNTLTFQINNSLPFASGGNVQLNYGVNIFNGWNLVTVTRKSSTGTKMYLNGNLVANNTSTYNPNYHSNMIPSIGSTDYGTTYNGLVSYYSNSGTKIDALNIWTKELTASEVIELYNSGNGAQYIGDNFYKPTTNDALNTNNGTAVGGLTYGLGKVGTAFSFNGTNALVSLPDNSLNLTGDFTVSGWVYVSNSGPQAILENSYYRTTPSYNYSGWGIFIDLSGTSTRKLGFIISRGTINSYLGWQFETTQLTLNAWNHIIVTRVAGLNTYAWINNIAQSYITLGSEPSSSININPVYTSTQKCTIGASNGGTSQGNFMKSNSQIDSLTIWNRQLTSEERTQLYNSGNGKQYPN